MRKIVQHSTGGPEVMVVEQQPKPELRDGQVLVRVKAAGINPVDTAVRGGFYPLLGKPPYTVGWDIAGEVVDVGKGVSNLKTGDQVFGMPNFPESAAAYAEYVASPADELAQRPVSLDVEQAAGLPLAGLTAWQGLVTVGRLTAGQRVLVHAAAGGVGHLAVQIAKAKGAHVVASASTSKLDYLRSIGADETIDYTKADFTARSDEFDIVFDPIAGEHAERSLQVLKKGGVLICLLDPSQAAREQAARQDKQLHRISVRPDGAGLKALADLADQGKLKVNVARTFDLEDAPAAHTFLASKPIGKIVLTV